MQNNFHLWAIDWVEIIEMLQAIQGVENQQKPRERTREKGDDPTQGCWQIPIAPNNQYCVCRLTERDTMPRHTTRHRLVTWPSRARPAQGDGEWRGDSHHPGRDPGKVTQGRSSAAITSKFSQYSEKVLLNGLVSKDPSVNDLFC